MGSELGYDIVGEYYREFLNTGRIEDLGTYVSAFYSTFDNSGYYYYILTITPSERFDEMRSADVEEARSRDREIAALLSSASAHYRANEDIMALSDVLSAVSLSLDGSIEYSADELLDRAMSYLGNIELTVSDAESAICSVRIRRTRGPFHPMVRSGLVDASYSMVNNSGEIIEDSVFAATESNGRFAFPWTNPYMIRTGAIRFSVDVPDDVMAAIERKAENGFLDSFYALLDEKSVEYRYELEDRFPREEAIIAIVPFMRGESAVFPEETIAAFSSQMESAGVSYDIVMASGEDEADIIRNLRALYPEKRYFIISYLAVTDYRESFDGYYCRVDGRSLVLDGESVMVEQEIFAASGGETEADAERNALERGARLAAGMLLKEI